ncbi:MAG TPA: discoidin domain-containing protein, partial [Terriglobales bacterium]|nr:discoidin domain-containing protein [Terriglobales bacterium]
MRAHRFLLPWTVVLSVLVAFLLTAVTAAIAQNPTAIQIAHRAAQLPSPAPSVEPPSLLRGTFEALEEFSAHNYRTRYFLNTGASRVELQFASNPPQLASGAAVQAQGTRIGNIMLLQSGNGPALQAAVPAPSIPLPGTLGAQSTIVILVNYQDLTIQPYTVADATTAVFTTLNNFIKENSFNQTSLTGDVFGWFTIKVNSSACDFNQIQTLADAAATNAGANLANYKHIIYAAPPVATCSWEGGSTIGGNPSRAWVNVDLRTGILALAHEFGHGLGIMHSHAESCNGTTIGNNCTVQEYGDLFDAMGNTNAMDYNGPQKERLGWQGNSLTKVQSTNTFTLIPYANPASAQGIRILEIPAGNDPATGNPSYYYVCYRQGVGFDSPISLYPSAAKGVLIHHSVPLDLNSTLLLDANPTTAWFNDAALLPGQTFTDSGAGVSITLNSADGTTASVKVTLSGPACTQHNPTVGIAPSNAVLAAGGLAKYNVTITDNDSAVCSSATFGLSATVPQGFTASFIGGSSVNLSPGGSTIKELDVTSPGNAALGGYNVSATATNGAFSGSGNATYTVGNPDFSIGASPSTVNIVQGQFGGTTITLTALGGFNSAVTLSNSPPPSNVIVAYSTNPVPGGAGSVTMSISVGASAPVGAWKITVGASGGGQTHSVDVNLNITAPVIPPPNVNPTLIPQSGFTVVADSEQAAFGANPASPARNAIDGNTGTIWETEYTPVSVPQPHWIRIDLGASYNVVGIKYTPRADGKTRGKIKAVEVYVTDDPNNWGLVAGSGTLLKNANDTRSEVDLLFNGKQGQIVVVRSLSEVKDGDWASAAEINVYQQSTGSCVHVGPQVTLAPKQSQGVQAGTAVTFTISVKNNDTAACSSTTFDVTSSVPQGWSPAVLGKNPPNFTLAPGATGSTTLQVTSPVSAVNGFYTVTGTATSESNSSL